MTLPPPLPLPNFRNFLGGAFVSNIGNNIQGWAIAWHVYHLTESSLMVGLLGLVRVVPLLVFSLFGGVLADHADRRTVLCVTQSAMAVVSLALCLFTVAGAQSLVVVYAAVALNAIARAFEQPARQATQVGLVPAVDYPNAASVNGVTWRLSDVMGPVVTGFLIAAFKDSPQQGLAICYGLNFISFFVLIFVVLKLPKRPLEDAPDQPHSVREVIDRIKEGLHFVNNTPVVRSAMWIDFWATLLSGAEALLPAFAAKILKLGPEGYGILAGSTGVGALIAAGFPTMRPTVRRQGPRVGVDDRVLRTVYGRLRPFTDALDGGDLLGARRSQRHDQYRHATDHPSARYARLPSWSHERDQQSVPHLRSAAGRL